MDRRIPIVWVIVYAIALAILAITKEWTAFIIVAIIGGPTTSLLFWLRGRNDSRSAPVKP